jgi:hypothetical protein
VFRRRRALLSAAPGVTGARLSGLSKRQEDRRGVSSRVRGPRCTRPRDREVPARPDRCRAPENSFRDRARGFARSIKPKMRPSGAAGEEVEEADAPSVGPGGCSSPRRAARRTSPRDRRFKTTRARTSVGRRAPDEAYSDWLLSRINFFLERVTRRDLPKVDTQCRSPATAQLSRRCTEKKRGCRVTVHKRTTRAADTPTPTLRRGEVRRHNRFDASRSHVPPRFGTELRARASPKAPERAHRTSRFPCTRVGRRERGSPKVASGRTRFASVSRRRIAASDSRRARGIRLDPPEARKTDLALPCRASASVDPPSTLFFSRLPPSQTLST